MTAGGPPPSGDLLDTTEAGPRVVRGGALRVLGYVAGVLLTTGSAAVLFRHLGVEQSGRYATVLAIVGIAGGLTDIGLVNFGIRELATLTGDGRDRFARELLGLRIVLTLLGGGVAVAFALIGGYPGVVVAGCAVAAGALLLQNVQATLGAQLAVDLRLGVVTAIEFVRQAVTALLIVGLVVAGATLLPLIGVAVVAAAVALALTAAAVKGRMPRRPAGGRRTWSRLVMQLLPFVAGGAIAAIYFRVALVLLSLMSDEKQTGYFGVSFRVVEVLVVLPQLMIGSAFPIFARAAKDDRERLAYGLDRAFAVCVLVGGAVLVALVAGAPVVIDVVGGAAFRPAQAVLRLQAVTLFAVFAVAPLSYALISLRLHRAMVLVGAGSLVVNIVMVVALVPSLGARGAALGTLFADVVALISTAVAVGRADGRLRPGIRRPLATVVAAAAALSLLAVPGLSDIATTLGSMVIFAALAVVLGALPEELRVEAAKVLRRAL